MIQIEALNVLEPWGLTSQYSQDPAITGIWISFEYPTGRMKITWLSYSCYSSCHTVIASLLLDLWGHPRATKPQSTDKFTENSWESLAYIIWAQKNHLAELWAQ